MTARPTAKYYFSGNPVPAREIRSDMIGPFDDEVVERRTFTAEVHVKGTVIETADDLFSEPTFEDAY